MRRFRRVGVVFGLSGAVTFGALGVGLTGASTELAPTQRSPEGCATIGQRAAQWERSPNDWPGSVDYLFTSYLHREGRTIDRRLPSPPVVRKYLKQARAAVEGLASLEDFKAAAASIAASELPDASRIGTTVEDALEKHKKKLRRTVKILETMLAKSLEKKAIETEDPTAGEKYTRANEHSPDIRGFSSPVSSPGTSTSEVGSDLVFTDDDWVTQGPAHPLVEKYNKSVRSLHLQIDAGRRGFRLEKKGEKWVGPALYRAVGDAVAFCAALADTPDPGRTPNTPKAPPVTTTTHPTTTTTYCYEDPPDSDNIICA